MKILSLLASGTEIVWALGLHASLVGRSHECDYPADVLQLPCVTAPKFQLDGRSYDIDERIKAILAEGLAIYRVDTELLRELKPDLIITQIQCEVCAVSARDVEASLREMVGYQPEIVSLNPNSLTDVFEDIRRIARAANACQSGETLIASMEERFHTIQSAAAGLPAPSVASIEWLSPLMCGGNWMPELIALAGGLNLLGEAGKHSPFMDFATLEAADPDIVLFLPCGFDIPRTARELPQVCDAEWSRLRASQSGEQYILDGNQYFNRPGPRLTESLEILFEIFHPEAASRVLQGKTYRGKAWVRADL